MLEQHFDKILNVRTTGDQKGFNTSLHYHKYEPTPYAALESFFKDFHLNANDTIVDFGCGKGRLNFFLNYLFNTNVIGIEMNEAFYYEAIENKDRYLKYHRNRAEKIHFVCCLAEEYKIMPSENRFYFFNPFSVKIFMSVVKNILLSIEENSREVDIILYYPAEDYIYYLETQSPFTMIKELNLPDQNPNERFLVYRLSFE